MLAAYALGGDTRNLRCEPFEQLVGYGWRFYTQHLGGAGSFDPDFARAVDDDLVDVVAFKPCRERLQERPKIYAFKWRLGCKAHAQNARSREVNTWIGAPIGTRIVGGM